MKRATVALAALVTLSAAAGCGDDAGDEDAGAAGDSGSDADSDADTDADGGAACTFEMTQEGGEIEACGLHLWVPAGAVAEAAEIAVTRIDPGASVPEGLALDSPVFALEPKDSDLSLLAYIIVHFPQSTGGSGVWVAQHYPDYGAWGVLETCYVDALWGGIRTSSFGTFTVLSDIAGNDIPSSGAGEGTWNGQSHDLDFSGIGHAHYAPSASGEKSVDLYGYDSDSATTLKIDFAIGDGDYGGEAIVTALDGWSSWPDVTPEPGVELSVTQPDANHLVGEMEGSLYRWSEADTDWVSTSVNGSFDVRMTRHFVGTDDPCPIPPMGGE